MWTLDEILLTVTLGGRFLAIGLLLAVVFAAVLRQWRMQRRQALETAGSRGSLELHPFQGSAGSGGEAAPPTAARRDPDRRLSDAGRKKRSAAYREGLLTFLGLAVLTAIEFAVSLWLSSLVLLFIIGLLKAALIIQYFMHVTRVWKQEEEEHA